MKAKAEKESREINILQKTRDYLEKEMSEQEKVLKESLEKRALEQD